MELPREEQERQVRELSKLRNRHHARLVEWGIARRILDAKVPVNYMQNADEFTEGTLLFPTRSKLAQTAIGTLWGIDETLSGSCSAAPQSLGEWTTFLREYPTADGLMLGRLEAMPRGYNQTTIYTGIQLVRGQPEAGTIPMNGVEPADVTELAALLHEVEELHLSGDLSALDPESLVNLSLSRPGPTPLP